MTGADLVVRADRAWVDGEWRATAVAVREGLVVGLHARDAVVPARQEVVLDADHVLLPGLVDSHVHVDEPGRTHWEGFATATRAAALGGVTTLVDMPLNNDPVTTSAAALAVKRASAEGRVHVDVAFWGGAVPGGLHRLDEMHAAGVTGFKCFTAPSGLDEFPPLDAEQLDEALAAVARLGTVLVVHAEDPALLAPHGALGRRHADFAATRPALAERRAVARLLDGVRVTGARAHVLHLADGGSLPMLRAARAEGLPVTVETCPHHLVLAGEDVPDGGTAAKCCPPLRDAASRDALWEGLLDGTIDCVVSDHSPAPASLKGDDFGLAWGGISGLQVGLRALWTGARRRGVPLDAVLPAVTTAPAALAGLTDRGRIAVGTPAHLVAFDPSARSTVRAGDLAHRCPVSAWDGHELDGRVVGTWLHGRRVVDAATSDGGLVDDRPGGRLLVPTATGGAAAPGSVA